MQSLIQEVENKFRKDSLPDVRSGDLVRVHQEIREGEKARIQVFEGTVIRTRRKKSLSYSITVRRLSGNVGVEKSFLLHSPNIKKVEITKRSKVRRKVLSYLRERQGKSARLRDKAFDAEAVNEPAADGSQKAEDRRQESENENKEAESGSQDTENESKEAEGGSQEADNKQETTAPSGAGQAGEKQEEPVEDKKDTESDTDSEQPEDQKPDNDSNKSTEDKD